MTSYAGKRVLITGGAGFIGSNLVKALIKEEAQIEIVDNLSSGYLSLLSNLEYEEAVWKNGVPTFDKDRQVTFIRDNFGSNRILDRVASSHYQIVFHQAAVPRVAYSVEHPIETMSTNLLYTANLFKACADSNTPIVWASSSSVYGGASMLPTHESERGKALPKSPYAMHKYHCEDYAEIFSVLYGLESIGLRYFNVFGPGQYGDSPYSTAVAAWCHAIKEGDELRSDGDGEQTRDMCYIDNVVQANLKAGIVLLRGEAVPGCRCYNIACGHSVSNNDILEYLSKRFDEDRVKVRHAPERVGDVKHTLADIDRAREELGYEVEVDFWEGLDRTIEWWDLA